MDLKTYGYRTNEDGTETRTWHRNEAGAIVCIHDAAGVCQPCRDADARIANA